MWARSVALQGCICSAFVIATAAVTFVWKLLCYCRHFTLVQWRLNCGHYVQDMKASNVLQCRSVLHVLVLITSSCWSLLRCSCVADSLQVVQRRPTSAANLSACLLTWWNPLSPPRRPTCPSLSITIRVPGSVRHPPPLCLGASAEPFPSAPSLPSPGQVWVKC